MSCPDDPAWCLVDHIRPHVAGWARSGDRPNQYRSLCPVRDHGDTHPSLAIGIGDRGYIVWNCFKGCDQADIRAALVRLGVPDGCLRRVEGQRTEDELVSALTKILENEPPGPGRELLIAATVWGRGMVPRGNELEQLAHRAGITRTTAYRVTATSQSGTSRHGYGVTARSHRETYGPNLGPSRDASTSGFAPAVTAGVRNRVNGQALPHLPRGPLTVRVRRCESCGCLLDPDSRADRRYCGAACRQRAARVRRAGVMSDGG